MQECALKHAALAQGTPQDISFETAASVSAAVASGNDIAALLCSTTQAAYSNRVSATVAARAASTPPRTDFRCST